jgi:hypothetical protein
LAQVTAALPAERSGRPILVSGRSGMQKDDARLEPSVHECTIFIIRNIGTPCHNSQGNRHGDCALSLPP